MAAIIIISVFVVFFILTFVAWRRYLWAAEEVPDSQADNCPYSLTEVFGERHLISIPHQEGAQWLTDIFGRSARKFPDHKPCRFPIRENR